MGMAQKNVIELDSKRDLHPTAIVTFAVAKSLIFCDLCHGLLRKRPSPTIKSAMSRMDILSRRQSSRVEDIFLNHLLAKLDIRVPFDLEACWPAVIPVTVDLWQLPP
jgi:hypothetical protein